MRNLLAILLLGSVITVFGQVDMKAKEILDKVSSTTKSYKSITADFNFTMQNIDADINETNAGKIIIQDNSYKLAISGIEIFNNGKTQWTYMPDASEVNIANSDSDDKDALNPATIFTIYENGYVFHYIGDGIYNGITTNKIELTPIEKRDFSKVILDINKSNYQIMSATMFGTDGNKYSIVVQKIVTDKTYPVSTFTFDKAKYPGVDEIDMR